MAVSGPSSEQRDVELAQGGDTEAFERLYRGEVNRVFGLARRMVGDDVAEDLTQEVFARAWQKLPSFEGRARFGTWLHRLAVNHLLGKRAQMARRQRFDGVLPDAELVPGRPAQTGLAMDLEWAIGTLPEGARQVFVLYDIEGYSHQEIAGTMQITIGTSKSQLHRARMILRQRLGGAS